MKATLLHLRPAAQLKAELDTREADRKDESFSRIMNSTIRAIEKAHEDGQRNVSILSIPDTVADALRANGYTIQNYPACGMGDMESTNISWG